MINEKPFNVSEVEVVLPNSRIQKLIDEMWAREEKEKWKPRIKSHSISSEEEQDFGTGEVKHD